MQINDKNAFNPGFNRTKSDLINLANNEKGLTPLEYIYSKNISTSNLLASTINCGLVQSHMIYTIGIDADIITARYAYIITEDAITINVETINSDHIHNKYEIDTHDLYVYDRIYFGTNSKDSETLIYGSFQLYGGGFDIGSASSPVSSVLIDTVVAEIAVATLLSIDATTFNSIVGTYYSVTSPVVSFNSPAFGVNFLESFLPVGKVAIYSGGSIYLCAPLVQIGPETPATITRTLNVKVNADLGIDLNGADYINLRSGIEGTTLRTQGDTQILSDVSCSIGANKQININIKNIEPLGNESINIAGPNINIQGDNSIEIFSDKKIEMYLPNVSPNGKMGLGIYYDPINFPIAKVQIDGNFIELGRRGSQGYVVTDYVTIDADVQSTLASGPRGQRASCVTQPGKSLLTGLETNIGYLVPNSDLGECQNIKMQSSVDINLSSKLIKIQNTDPIFGILQPEVQYYTNTFNVNAVGSGIADRNISSINLTSDHGITIQNNAPLSTLNILSNIKDINIKTNSVADINLIAGRNVSLNSSNILQLRGQKETNIYSTEGSINLVSSSVKANGTIESDSLIIPVLEEALGEGALVFVGTGVGTVTGTCNFTLFNLVTAIDGQLKTVDYNVTITFV